MNPSTSGCVAENGRLEQLAKAGGVAPIPIATTIDPATFNKLIRVLPSINAPQCGRISVTQFLARRSRNIDKHLMLLRHHTFSGFDVVGYAEYRHGGSPTNI